MTQPRTWGHNARQMGDYITDLALRPTPTTARYCTRCHARLRQANPATLCAPCGTTINPWVTPTPRPPTPESEARHLHAKNTGPACPTCNGPKHAHAHQCHTCYTETRPLPKMDWSRKCHCGGPKASGATQCRPCAYGTAA